MPLTLDTTKPEPIAAAVTEARDVTLLINNAGVATSQNVLTMAAAENRGLQEPSPRHSR